MTIDFNPAMPINIKTAADLPRAIALADAAGAIGAAHLLRAARDGRINLLVSAAAGGFASNSAFKGWAGGAAGQPAIVVLGDDSGLNQGPAGWPIAERVVAWSRSIVIHASGAEIAHYETAIVAAELVQRVLIVECSSATAPAWIRLVKPATAPRGVPILVIRPQNGGVHPVPLDRRVLQ